MKIVKDLLTISLDMRLVEIFISFSPFNVATINAVTIINVDVFIPPPVPPGEAPINMRTIITTKPTTRLIVARSP